MLKRLKLFMMLMLLITLSGWTQSSENWRVIENKQHLGDTIIQYNFHKSDLRDLRLYVASLETFKEVSVISDQIIIKQTKELETYKNLTLNQDIIIDSQKKVINESKEINESLEKDVQKYKKKASRWPYWLGGGFIGGLILCLSVR